MEHMTHTILNGYFFWVPNNFSPSFLLLEILEVLDEPIGVAGRHYKKSVVITLWRKIRNDWLENHIIFITLPETNIFAPENRPLEKEIPIGNHHF